MNSFSINVKSLFDGESLLKNQTVTVREGYIETIIKTDDKDKTNSREGVLIPGYIDIQVNGGGGYFFNQSPEVETIRLIGEAHQQFGTTGWLPTLISDCYEKMQQAAESVASARKSGVPGVLGIHFEGPHLSVDKRGVHGEKYIRSIGERELALFSRKDLGQVIITVAPENVSTDTIETLVAAGVKVCLGHSNATYQQASAAIMAGASGFTHLYNAMSQLNSREPGMVGAAFSHTDCYSGLIMDNIHVHPASAKLAIEQIKNIMLVTDAMPCVGTEQSEFDFFGQKIIRKNGRLTDQEGRLAGSVLDMAQAVSNCINLLNLPFEKSVNLASINPARFLGVDSHYGALVAGKKASMVLLDDNYKVISSWIDGEQVV